MAREKKTHIPNPRDRKESLCVRRSVEFAKKNSRATCKTCQYMAVNGTLQNLEFEHNTEKWGSYNNKGKPRFTEKQMAFAAHPQVNTNATQAALAVGYSASFAKSQAIALRKQLSPLIMEYQEKAKQLAAISVAKVQTELASMGFANVIDYFDIDEDGSIRPKQLNHLTREQAAAIQEVEVIPFLDAKTGLETMVIGKLKLADKRANLVELGKTLGMFNKVQVDDKRDSTMLLKEVPTDALQQAETLLMDAVKVAREQRTKNDAIPGDYKELSPPVTPEK